MKKVKLLKHNGELEYFDEAKFRRSLKRSGASQALIGEVLNQIEPSLKEGMTTAEIYKNAFEILSQKERKVATSYSLRSAVMELGPTGFPFEKFIAEIFKEKGFEALTGQIVMGSCVPHEVDVVAYNDEKLLMVEVKFHNRHGIKTDLKVALYVKARFEDIRGNMFFYGKKRSLDEGWLITNTKFTSTAVEYGECNGIKMVGWNYPKKENLQNMIEESGLHPLTCLKSLKQSQKKMLLNQDIVLCKKINEDTGILKSLGMNDKKIKEVLDEINSVCYGSFLPHSDKVSKTAKVTN